MKKIDLSRCEPGDILISSLGARLEYVAPTPWENYDYLDHVVKYVVDENGVPYPDERYGTRTHDGFVFAHNRQSATDHDIVKIVKVNKKNKNRQPMSLLEKIKADLAIFERNKNDLIESIRDEFPFIFEPLFEEFTELESFSWNQYTPYFNDGDDCEFSVYNEYPDVFGIDDDLACHAESKISELLQMIPEDFYKFLFGDHVTVTVHRNGTLNVTECHHD